MERKSRKSITLNLINPSSNKIDWTKQYFLEEQFDMTTFMYITHQSEYGAELERVKVATVKRSGNKLEQAKLDLIETESRNGVYIVEVIDEYDPDATKHKKDKPQDDIYI